MTDNDNLSIFTMDCPRIPDKKTEHRPEWSEISLASGESHWSPWSPWSPCFVSDVYWLNSWLAHGPLAVLVSFATMTAGELRVGWLTYQWWHHGNGTNYGKLLSVHLAVHVSCKIETRQFFFNFGEFEPPAVPISSCNWSSQKGKAEVNHAHFIHIYRIWMYMVYTRICHTLDWRLILTRSMESTR